MVMMMVIIWLMNVNNNLIGGIPTPLINMKVIWDDDIPNIWKNQKCSKPPTRNALNNDHPIYTFRI